MFTGRTSSTGSSFLIERPDSCKYLYQRKLPDHLRPLVQGVVTIPWKARIVAIDGPDTIKISLGTGDLVTAQGRRDQIHVQIEDLVARAKVHLDAKNKDELATQVSGLVAADIRRMAGQVGHDILAADDRALVDLTWRAPLADLIGEIRVGAGVACGDPGQAAQDVERRKARANLAARDLASFDTPIEEGEIATDPDLVTRLREMAKQRDVRGQRLGDDDRLALSRRPDAVTTIPSPVAAIMAENGVALPIDHPDRRQLALDVLRAQVAAHRVVEARRSGDATPTPERPAPIVLPPPGETLSRMRARWIELHKPGRKARDDNKLYLEAFISLHGDIPAASVTRKIIRDFRDLLKRRPRNMPAEVAKLALRDQVAWGDRQNDCRRLAAQTVNAKGLGSLRRCSRLPRPTI